MPSLDPLHHPHVLMFRQEQTAHWDETKGAFPHLGSHPSQLSTCPMSPQKPGRSLSPCQPGPVLVPRDLCPWRAAPCLGTKQRRPPAWGTTGPCTGKRAQGMFTAPVDNSAPEIDMKRPCEGCGRGEELLAPTVLLTSPMSTCREGAATSFLVPSGATCATHEGCW